MFHGQSCKEKQHFHMFTKSMSQNNRDRSIKFHYRPYRWTDIGYNSSFRVPTQRILQPNVNDIINSTGPANKGSKSYVTNLKQEGQTRISVRNMSLFSMG